MQFFPSPISAPGKASELFSELAGQTAAAAHGSFDSVLSSFIEEGRSDYSGRPAGFAAYEDATGTLGEREGNLLKEALQKRNTQKETLNRLEQLMNSGGPVTIGKLVGTLTGNARISKPLEGEELDSFKLLLSKMGFSKDEVDELAGLADEGKGSAAMKRIAGRLSKLEGDEFDMTKGEFAALLKGLDLSDATSAQLQKLFGETETLRLNKDRFDALLVEANKELANRDLAAKAVQQQMRAAIEETLQASKLKKLSEPVTDIRGTRRTEQSEVLMQNSVLKKAGENAGRDDVRNDARNDTRDESRDEDKKGNSRAERILASTADDKAKEGKKTEGSKDIINQILHRVDVAGGQAPANNAPQAQNLNSMARSFRQEIFSQVENGILQNAQNGVRQLTLQLTPQDLGQLTVILSVTQGEVRATIKADQPESAGIIREQMAELKASLEAQGLKVKELDVQTNMRENSLANQWDGLQEHNLMRDSQERDRMMRLSQMRRGTAEAGPHEVLDTRRASVETTGLHIVA